jgi:hypothetical protein
MTKRGKGDPLQRIPGVGPSIAHDLRELGYGDPAALVGGDPEEMYSSLCRIRGERQDPCVLYVFRCAVYFASARGHHPELLKWWNWKNLSLEDVLSPKGTSSRTGRS